MSSVLGSGSIQAFTPGAGGGAVTSPDVRYLDIEKRVLADASSILPPCADASAWNILVSSV